jgi:hypothetical protein
MLWLERQSLTERLVTHAVRPCTCSLQAAACIPKLYAGVLTCGAAFVIAVCVFLVAAQAKPVEFGLTRTRIWMMDAVTEDFVSLMIGLNTGTNN